MDTLALWPSGILARIAANPNRKQWFLSNLPNMSRSIPCLSKKRKLKTPGQVDSQAERWQK
jgi:hypothetical protein